MAKRINPYITLNGQAREAIDFYARALNAKLLGSMTFGDMPADPAHPMSEETKKLVAHALLKVGDTDLMVSDCFPGQPVQAGNQVAICVVAKEAQEARQIFEALAQGGVVAMPLQETSWSPAYGMVTDKYGVAFQITTEVGN